jgi:hypothetical protein
LYDSRSSGEGLHSAFDRDFSINANSFHIIFNQMKFVYCPKR